MHPDMKNITFNILKTRNDAKSLKNGGGFLYDKMIQKAKNVIATHLKD